MNKLKRIAGLIHLRMVCRGTGTFMFLVGLVMMGMIIADILMHFHKPGLITGFILFCVFAVWAVRRFLLKNITASVTAEHAARLTEQKCGLQNNILINCVQLWETDNEFTKEIRKDAVRSLDEVNVSDVVSARTYCAPAVLALLTLAVLALFFSQYSLEFTNSFRRFFLFAADIRPVTRTSLAVHPGDAVVPEGGSLTLDAVEKEDPVDSVTVTVRRGEGEPVEKKMSYLNGRFVFHLNNITHDTVYTVKGGDFESPEYRINVIKLPVMDKLTLRFEFPESLGRSPRTLDVTESRTASVPPGTAVFVQGECSQVLASVTASAGPENLPLRITGKTFRTTMPLIAEENTYLDLVYQNGHRIAGERISVLVQAMELKPPAVRMVRPGRHIALLKPAPVEMLIEGRDLYGIASVQLKVWQESTEPRTAVSWEGNGKTGLLLKYTLDLAKEDLKPGTRLYYQACITSLFDRLEPGESGIYSILLTSPEKVKQTVSGFETDFREKIRRIISLQTSARGNTRSVVYYTENNQPEKAGEFLFYLDKEQKNVNNELFTLKGQVSQIEALALMYSVISGIYENEIEKIRSMTGLVEKTPAAEKNKRIEYLKETVKVQTEVISKLNSLLVQKHLYQDKLKKAELDVGLEDLETLAREGQIKNIMDQLEKFKSEQKEMIELTKSLIGKDADDLTEEEKEMVEKIRASQEKWSEFFQETADQIAKLMDQDFSDSTLADEFVEAYSEIEKAAEELVKGNYEIAVPFEQAGVEKAETLTANLEKWLPDHRDNAKWVMEEPLEDYDVPMAELPEELDDLIGDLIDDLDQMTEETEDVTSAWADSLDEGAGWGVADGPISNMSAKGKTGNIMPNSNEVGGRSGEGRSGKSSGQFVEKTATGKGGRETPSRVTPDPYESGDVKDTSGEQGGATGGGKKAGAGGEGLRGTPPPPEIQKNIDRLSGKQAELISKAEKLQRGAKKLNYNTRHLDSVIDDMKEVYQRMSDYEYQDYSKKMKVIVENLKAIDSYYDSASSIVREESDGEGKQTYKGNRTPEMDSLPEGYEDMVKGYFRRLTE